jgi:hypothetical protein
MAALLTKEFRTNNLVTFLDNYFGVLPVGNMYMSFGQPSPWPNDINGKDENQSGFIVPALDNQTAAAVFRQSPIASIKIAAGDVSPVIVRKNWTINTQYTTNTVVVTDEWNVYSAKRLVNNNTKPTHTSYTDSNNDWAFLYKITSPTMFTRFVTDEWIPVIYNNNTGTDGLADPEAIYKAGTITFMINKTIGLSDFTQEELNDFRRIALWSNPLNLGARPLVETKVLASTMNVNSGTIVYVDNRLPVYRYTNQTEEFKILIGF